MKNRLHLQILEKRAEATDAVSLVLKPIDGFFSYKPGQFLTLILTFNGKEVRRSYSFSSSPGVDHYPIITVKRKPNGLVSSFLVGRAGAGDILAALPPAGQFTLPAFPQRPHYLFMVAGGSGITPVFSIIKYALACTPHFHLILAYANRDEKNLIFGKELNKWLQLYPERFRALLLLSTPKSPVSEIAGAIQAQVLPKRMGNALLEELIQKNVPADGSPVDFYLCGPPGLLLKSEMAIRFLGYPGRQIHKEIFAITPPLRPPAEQFPDATVTLARNGEEVVFNIKAGQTILEAAGQAGLDLPYSCRSGICTSCTARCQEGEIIMYGQEGPLSSKVTDGVVQTCVGYPLTRQVAITF